MQRKRVLRKQCRLEWTYRLSLLIIMYLCLLLVYKLNGFILSVSIVTFVRF